MAMWCLWTGRGVGNNSIQCTSCQTWVHKKCGGIRGSMSKVQGRGQDITFGGA